MKRRGFVGGIFGVTVAAFAALFTRKADAGQGSSGTLPIASPREVAEPRQEPTATRRTLDSEVARLRSRVNKLSSDQLREEERGCFDRHYATEIVIADILLLGIEANHNFVAPDYKAMKERERAL